jgi:hypothetical protein
MAYVSKGHESAVAQRLRTFNNSPSDPLFGVINDTYFMQIPRFFFEKGPKQAYKQQENSGSPIVMSVAPRVAAAGILFIQCLMSPSICEGLESVLGVQRLHRERDCRAIEPLTGEAASSLTMSIADQQERLRLPPHLKDIHLFEYVNVLGGSFTGSYGIVKGIKDNMFEVRRVLLRTVLRMTLS